jgi:hypothetical protein
MDHSGEILSPVSSRAVVESRSNGQTDATASVPQHPQAAPQSTAHAMQHLKAQIKLANKYAKKRKFSEAYKLLNDKAFNKSCEVKRLRAVSSLLVKENRYAEAADTTRQAFELKSKDADLRLEYVDRLTDVHVVSKAFEVFNGATKQVKESRNGQFNLYWIYRLGGWAAHANAVRFKYRIGDQRLRERIPLALKAPVRPILKLIEKREIDATESRCSDLAMLDSINFQTAAKRYAAYAITESAIRAQVRNAIRARIFRITLNVLLLAAFALGAATYFAIAAEPGGLISQLLVGIPLAIATFWVAGEAWDKGRTLLTGLLFAGFTALLIGSIGLYFSIYGIYSIIREVGRGLVAGATCILVMAVAVFVTNFTQDYIRRRTTSEHSIGSVIEHLLNVLADMNSSESGWRGQSDYYTWRLESASHLLEAGAKKPLDGGDPRTQEWMSSRLLGAAEGLRYMKRLVLAPDGKSRDRLLRLLRRQVTAIATDNWMNTVHKPPPPTRPTLTRKEKLTKWTRIVIVALLPAVALLAISPFVELDAEIGGWAKVAALTWTVLTILWAVDPTIREKIDVARNVATSVREFGTKSGGSETPSESGK